MNNLVKKLRASAFDKDNFPRMKTELVFNVATAEMAADRIEELEAENERLRYGHYEIKRECSQENADGEPFDTFQEIAVQALEGTDETT